MSMRIPYTTILCISLLLFWKVPASHSSNALYENIEDCYAIEHFHPKALCIQKRFNDTKSIEEKEEIFKVFLEYWENRDGAQGYTLSDIFLDILEHNPEFFFSQMENYQEHFEEWLDKLLYLSFTWHDAPPSPLPEKKERILNSLREYHPGTEENQQLYEKFFNTLISIEPRQIQ